MKKIFYLASIAALALSSCTKDETTQAAIEDVKGGSKIVAAMEADDTRTHLATSNDVDFSYRWSLGDQLGIYGYGENTLSNAAFVLDNASDNSPVGVFTSQHKLNANKSYMAVYPRFAEPLFDVAEIGYVKDIVATSNYHEDYYEFATVGESVTMKILPEQKYQDKTFYTTTAPAISGEFSVSADGEANIAMQPVADYLMVNVRSTEEIKTLTLQLRERTSTSSTRILKIAGTSNLASYWFNGKDGWEYRYYIPEGGADVAASFTEKLDGETITIKTDEAYRTIACHDPNTYVFTIPAGILGMDKNIEARIWVNAENIDALEDADTDFIVSNHSFKSTAFDNLQGQSTNDQMNFAKDGDKKIYRLDENKSNENKVVRQLENTVFWANPMIDTNRDGVKDTRDSFLYNPNDDVIIEDEAQLLEYFSDYDKSSNKKVYHKDAFLCAGATFDFSEANMLKRAAEYEDTPYEDYIANYLAKGFPCISNYNNNFVGNGAQIVNIFKPLQSEYGLFGGDGDWNSYHHKVDLSTRAGENVAPNQGASISNVTFSNIVAKTIEGTKQYDKNDKPYRVDKLGYILAASFGGKIKDVTVSNSYGEAVMGEGRATQLAGLTVKDADKLCNVFDALYLNNHIDLTNTWADLSTVNGEVFEYIIPYTYEGVAYSATNTDERDLNVITIANGNANTYAKLTYEVLYNEDIDDVAAVVIGGVSYWTGGEWGVENTAYNVVKNNDGTVIGRYIQYAEELAAGYTTPGMKAVLARNIDLNWGNLQWFNNYGYDHYYDWNMENFNELDGAGKSISNVTMVVYDYTANSLSAETEVAPFKAAAVKNLTMNNVAINIWTPDTDNTITVPEFIGGVALNATTVNNVALNNLSIETYRSDNSANQEGNYKAGQNSKIGWVVASAEGTVKFEGVTVNGVESNVKGISGVVGQVTVSNASGSAQFVRVASTNVDDTVNTAISKFAKYNGSTIVMAEGTVVGLVNNNKAAGLDLNVEFKQSGKPLFYYSIANTGCDINVNYDEAEYEILSK